MKKLGILLILTLGLSIVKAQEKIMVDQIVAVVGNKMVKHSDVEAQIANMKMQGETVHPASYCEVLERLMINKLYENQAELDSIEIPESEVEANLDRRIRYFTQQIGSKERLEEFYNKSILAIKEEFREMIKSQMISERMEAKITEEVKVTPSEVRQFYKDMPSDSIPLIETEFEVYQIIKKPDISQAIKDETMKRLNDLRARILKGERFSSLATFYSEDPGSARKGGELGFFGRGEMYSEFESTAFSLKEGEVSPVIETKAGYHILQLVERQGDNVNVRHILLQPKADVVELDKAQKFLDSVAKLIRDSVHTFEDAAQLFSDDPSGRYGGLYTGPYSGNARVTAEEMDPNIFFIVDKFSVGQVSNATPMETEDREKAVRIIWLKNRIAPHKANLETDYDKIYNLALMRAREKEMTEWLEKRLKTVYVRMNGKARECEYKYNWIK